MKLQTSVPLDKAKNPIDYNSKVLLIGSCFSENIGNKLDYFKFQYLQNPFGILFHPLAIENFLERAIEAKWYTESEVFERDGIWSCFDAHSKLNSLSQEQTLNALNGWLEETASFLKEATHVFITLGTAWVYQHKSRELPVANCHKVPQKEFEKKLLSPKVLIRSLEKSINLLQSIGSKKQIVFTVSPVRHLKDGFVENQRSKANLINAVHAVLSSNTDSGVGYFPSYEIMMDELRDYRFYEKDMVHPNALGIDYIWERFTSVYISEKTQSVMDKVDKIQKRLLHKPFAPDSDSYKTFEKDLQAKIEYIQKKYPTLKFYR
ncbi:MAG: GSCFA domain-containing protein [Bacteroidota bacterium]